MIERHRVTRLPSPRVAAARVRIKRRLARAGFRFSPDISTHDLIGLALYARGRLPR